MTKAFRIVAIMLGMVMSMGFVSCGDDDDEPSNPTTTENDVTVSYNVTLSQAYYDYFNITVTYTDINGNEKTETITGDWKYPAQTIKESKAAKAYSLSVVAKPKSSNPEIVEGQAYKISHSCSVYVYVTNSDGGVIKTNSDPTGSSTMSVGNNNAIDYFTQEHSIFSRSYSL